MNSMIIVLVVITSQGWQHTQNQYATMISCLETSSAVRLLPTLCVEKPSR